MHHLAAFAASIAAVSIASPAAADVTRCAGADTDLQYRATDLAELHGDTGWVPAGSPAQVRVTGRVAGETTVAMGVHPTVCWATAMELNMPGRPGAGLLDFAYGAELQVFGQIHTTVLGNQIDWEGEIPIPRLPHDLLLAKTTTFEPSVAATVSGSDVTDPVTVLSTNLIGALISVTGISGGLHLDVTGAMTASYRTTAIEIGDGAITPEIDHLAIPVPAGGYGAALDRSLTARGRVTYAPSLTFTIAFDVKILGIRVVNWQLFSVPMALPPIERDVTLDSTGAHIGLPKSSPLARSQLDFASSPTQRLAVHNAGEAPLMIEPSALPAGVTMELLTVAPGADGALEVVATDSALRVTDHLTLLTNDPGQPTITVTLGRDIGGTGTEDPDGEHSGCDAGAGSAGLLVALATLRLRRRRAPIT